MYRAAKNDLAHDGPLPKNVDYRQAIDYLDRHTNFEGSKSGPKGSSMPTAGLTDGLSLAPIRELLGALGDPQDAYRVIHITGTNGKGSTAKFTSAILAKTELSVGVFTSPNLEHVNERIMWGGNMISNDDFARVLTLLSDVEPLLENKPGRFDLLAAAALVWFAELGVEVAVIEVGMLGRFDSTNVVTADVAILTNIGKDHTDGADGWREAIVNEKAGIIKHETRVVLGEPFDDLRSIVDQEVAAVGAEQVWEYDTDFEVIENRVAFGGRALDIRTPNKVYEELFLPVHGAHQGMNLASAIAAVEAFFGRGIETDIVNHALEGIELPGRFEVVGRQPTVILDGAHNREGSLVAKETLDAEFTRLGSWILVVGMLSGKDPEEILNALGAQDFDAVIVTEPTWSRAIPARDIGEAAQRLDIEVDIVLDPNEALDRARSVAGDDDLILVTGSLYLIGDVRSRARSVVAAEEFDSAPLPDQQHD